MPIIDDLVIFLHEEIASTADMTVDKIMKLIDEFDQEQKKKYLELKKDNKISFGKFKGYTCKELALTDKGKLYLQWLLGQTWFVEKYTNLVNEINALGIKKAAPFKRAPLE